MNNHVKIKRYKWNLLLLLTVSVIFVLIPGCSAYRTYTGKVGNATYSFQYPKDYTVNPPNPFSSATRVDDPLAPEAFISVISHLGTKIETSLGSYRLTQDPLTLDNFRIVKEDTIQIAGFPAQHTIYSYIGYTTRPVHYGGDFASFFYKGYTIEIHIVAPAFFGSSGSGADPFDLLVKSFKIKE